MASFNPHLQNVTFLAADGRTQLHAPLAQVDAMNHESFSICISYGSQLGACVIMLVVVLILTPAAKLRRPSSVLHVLGLLVCMIRMALLCAWFPSPFNNFYAFWANDYSHLRSSDFQAPVAANIFSMLLVIIIEAALMYQAWTMVSLWRYTARVALGIVSAAITLLTIGWRIAFTVIQTEAVLTLVTPPTYIWVVHSMIITNLVSICWFCALFNIKLAEHLISNRGVLPSYKFLTPMEILIMTNGLLMVIPVVFASLEWGQFTNFESASLTMTSVVVILPLGTLAAQRMANTNNLSHNPEESSGFKGGLQHSPDSTTRLKDTTFSISSATGTMPQSSILSRCEAGGTSYRDPEAAYMELGPLDPQRELANGQVRVDHDLEQRVDRI
ncbi:hypothetical protein S7711_04784 [Stachybotrys chartarum IBT 7711]|uniref:Pheromone receptor n=1 Tax=Stachybotrys chartarum (strain CBS 109288 / IBT 7711) TaxID=1280523 RepID=A0A084ASH4_STACB|nr:hypothetical protein S7711_04784 [Stachybotrys chartarum IBT 7711]KFA77955.1 hypothetical protein S40288_08289 [Stachybotrys chartarum IBT 40288]